MKSKQLIKATTTLGSFFKYSLGSIFLLIMSLILLNSFIYMSNDKILSTKITLIISYFNYLFYYIAVYKIQHRLFFIFYFTLNALFFRVCEFYAITYLLNFEYNHNIVFIFVMGCSHICKYLLMRTLKFIWIHINLWRY